MTTYPLYDEKGSCELCSTTFVKRRVPQGEQASHAEAHKKQGDNVQVETLEIVVD